MTWWVPRMAFWLDGFGWGVENYGVEPDVELIPTPDDWAAGRDVQLETAVRLALEALRDSPAVSRQTGATGRPDVGHRSRRGRPEYVRPDHA
jgi:tricorn protease